MPGYLSQLGETMGTAGATGLLGAGMGLLLEGHNDKRQLRQQGKLQAQEIAGQKEMTDYNMMKQLEMWKNTSYGAQMEQLRKAGLNPGLLYGMGGGSGATTGQAAGNVTGGHAPQGGQEVMGMMNNAIQLGLMKAQKENIEADTANKKAEIPVKGATVPKLQAETTGIALNNYFLSQSMEDRIDSINSDAILKIEEINRSIGHSEQERRTREARIQTVLTEAIQKQLENALIEQGTKEKKQNIEESKSNVLKNEAQIKTWAEQLAQGLTHLDIQQQDINIKKFLAEFNANHPGLGNVLGGAIQRLADGISKPLQGNKVN